MPYQGRLPYTYKSPYNTTLDQGTQTVPSLAFLGDTNNGLFSPATDNVAITTNGSEKLRVTDTGNIGIGTTNPSSKLHVYNGDLELTGGYNLTWGGTFSGGNPTIWGNASNKTIRFAPDGNTTGLVALLGASSSYILGNVGIGTTNPIGVFHTRITTDRNLIFNTSIGGDARITALNDAANTNVNFVLQGTDVILQSTGGSLRVASSGNVGIGTTNPATKLDVNGNIFPTTDATYNLGSSTKRWANIYSADLQLSNEGSSNDVDGTWGQYTIQEGENDLFLLNRRNGKKYKFVLQEVN